MVAVSAVKIDDVLVSPQPSEIDVSPPQGSYSETRGGGFVRTERLRGTIATMRWGRDASPDAILSDLRTKRGSTAIHTLKYTPAEGSGEETVDIFMDPPRWSTQLPEILGTVEMTFRERSG